MKRVKKEYIVKTYGITEWTDETDFLEQMAKKKGRLLKGGVADTHTVAKMILNDWQRGKIPYFCRPPGTEVRGILGFWSITSEVWRRRTWTESLKKKQRKLN